MRPKSASTAAHDLAHALFLADVGGVAARRAARVGDLARDRFQLLRLAADQRHARAERGQFMRRAAADAAAGAGHDAGLALEQFRAKDRLICRHADPGNSKPEKGFSKVRKLYQANAW